MTGLRTTRSSLSTVATRRPLWSKISALAGTLTATSGCGRSKLTLAKAPVISSPLALSTTSSIRVVPEPTSTAWAEASTVAENFRPGYSGTDMWALVPIRICGT